MAEMFSNGFAAGFISLFFVAGFVYFMYSLYSILDSFQTIAHHSEIAVRYLGEINQKFPELDLSELEKES